MSGVLLLFYSRHRECQPNGFGGGIRPFAVVPAVPILPKKWDPVVGLPRRATISAVFWLCLARLSASMDFMLAICTDTLPQTCLSYLAFRVSFRETLDRIALARQMDDDESDCFGYLTEVPFLCCVPAHVQLDLLAETWSKHVAHERIDASLVDESVIYAVCETAAQIVEAAPDEIRRYLRGGPQNVALTPDHSLASELRSLHLNLENEGDFLLISQFEDLRPDESRWMKRKFRLDQNKLEAMFAVLARWNISPNFAENLSGLLSDREIPRALSFLGVKVHES